MSTMARARIHGIMRSTWTRTAVLTCEAKHIDYELVAPTHYGTPEHLALHPFGRIPVVEIDGLTLFSNSSRVASRPRGRPRTTGPNTQSATARSALQRVDALIGPGPMLCGNILTLADLWLAPQIDNATEKHPAVLDGLEAIAAWRRSLGPLATSAEASG